MKFNPRLSPLKFIKSLSTYNRKLSTPIQINLPNGLKYFQPRGIFINNKFYETDETIDVENPSTESKITSIFTASNYDIDHAIESADLSFNKIWKNIEPLNKFKMLNKLADLIELNSEILASIESFNNGKTLNLSRDDVQLTINYFRSTAGYADKLNGRTIQSDSNNKYMNFTIKEPIGVCGQIIPWNFPLLMFAWKVAPAIITGNTTIIKPASSTPLSALFLGSLIVQSGIPEGVINILPGSGTKCGDYILNHPKIKKISFTGSTKIGKEVMIKSAQNNLKKITLELGGKSPNIVLDDCNLSETLTNLTNGIFKNSGQICSSGSRIYVQDTIYEKLLVDFKSHLENNVKVGDPFDESNYQGAITNRKQYETILSYIKIGKQTPGIKLLTGGDGNPYKKGYFIKPTVFYDVPQDCKLIKEEIFGPIVTISKFHSIDEVIKLANDSEYGLGAGIQTTNISKALKIAKELKSGTVWINTYNDFHEQVPFGGFKQSGFGKEMGEEALDSYTQIKAVRIRL
ncbi:hypothetical protein WICMUC_004764 [Wickerhamomyces mucosus]|uniref:Aldehyde dehydrogenase domain-containing protein n=1 Tax=Wickerhamomyces mucosus TaxID=1378264 RepID=A0A9P8PF74_9ASCO|nr:hypothetical protein WICMUC_004764 [Wickerhamomyces mucosus]